MTNLFRWAVVTLALALIFTLGSSALIQAQFMEPPEVRGSWGFYSGNELMSNSMEFQLAYIAGAYDMLETVLEEYFHIATSNIPPPGVGAAEWNSMSPYEQMDYAAYVTIARVLSAVSDVPNRVRLGQVSSVINQYIENHPVSWHHSAALLIWRALAETGWE